MAESGEETSVTGSAGKCAEKRAPIPSHSIAQVCEVQSIVIRSHVHAKQISNMQEHMAKQQQVLKFW